MKLGFKLMLFGLVAMVALPFIIIKPDGTRMMTPQDLLPGESTFSDAGRAISAKFGKQSDNEDSSSNQQVNIGSGDSLRGSGKMYSWRDSKGQMHFSEHPPEDTSAANVASLPEDVNLMQAVKVPRTAGGSAGRSTSGQGGGFQLAFPSTIPARDIPKLMNDAKAVQSLADKRNAAASEI